MDSNIVIEKWIKPPTVVTYQNSRFIAKTENSLTCEFFFPKKYYENDFFLFGKKVLERGELYRGIRHFYSDRFYSLLEYYSDKNELVALYFDVSLPANIINEREVEILDLKLDFFILVKKNTYYLLDEDELEEAITADEFTNMELDACRRSASFLKEALEKRVFDNIFLKYEKTSPACWSRYSH